MTATIEDRDRVINPSISDQVRGRPITGADLVDGVIWKITPGERDGVIYHVRQTNGQQHEMRQVTVTKTRAERKREEAAQAEGKTGAKCKRCKYKTGTEDIINGVAVRVCDECGYRASFPEKGEKITYTPPK